MQQQAAGAAMPPAVPVATFDSVLTALKLKLPPTVADSVTAIEKELAAISDSAAMIPVYTRLYKVWERQKLYPAYVYYRAKVAKLENSEKNLTFAAQLFLELMEHEHDRSVQMWEAAEAITCLEQVLKLNEKNEEAQLAMASAYIQGTAEPMKGVQMALAIARDKPDNIPVNMLLGRMSIQSGQFEKAIKRFETVLKQEPANKEALYFLAQAYEGTGNKTKAIELLEKCKQVVNNAEFSRDIDQYINSLK